MSKQSISEHALEIIEKRHGDIDAYLVMHGKKNKQKTSNAYYKLVNEEIKRLQSEQKRQDKLDKEELKRSKDERKREDNIEKERLKNDREIIKLERKDSSINRKEHKPVPVILLKSNKGFSTMKKVKVQSGEILANPDKKNDIIYAGVVPTIVEIESSIFPGLLSRLLLPRKFRAILHYNVKHQPITRDLFDGSILDPLKKRKVLIERKVIDKEGFYLDEEGNRALIEGHHVKIDISDIDFIKSEFHALEQSKSIEKAATAMSKTGQAMDKMWMWILIAAFVCITLTVFLTTGGTSGWF